MIGKTLGHYSLASLLGKGGMGEVYKAKDEKLGRDVAIKVLPEEFAKDADRVARFQREAKLLASLNHPNIAAIHGLEESDRIHFLVLELIEGDTLSDRLKHGAIPAEEALKLALQIAEALEAAHEKGVIHRDLKPANIKVTPDGKVKVLDFGLAKIFAGEQQEVILSESPTLSVAATQQGVILGTAAYMSPEQAKGKTVDKRADIWAFGVVLFEMLTGRQLFAGEAVSETLAAVLMREPDFSKLSPNLHPRIRLLLERCLEKEAKNRYGVINDARVDIQKVISDPSGLFAPPATAERSRTGLRAILLWVAAIFLASIIVGVTVWNLRTPEPRQVMLFDYGLPEEQEFANLIYPVLSVSPNGRQFVYCTAEGIYLRSMNELDARCISSANEISSNPFFSPDGQWLGYFSMADAKLKKTAIHGGITVTLCDATNVIGASWGTDDTIVYVERGKGIMQISSTGGSAQTLIESGNEAFYHPRLLPDGKTLMFTLAGDEGYSIAMQSLKSGKRKILFPGDNANYLPTGLIVYAFEENLYAVPFDLNALQETGSAVQIVEGVFRNVPQTSPQYAISVSDELVYLPATPTAAPKRTLVWVDRKGNEEPLNFPTDAYSCPRISPDGKQVALIISKGNKSNVWIGNLTRGEGLRQLTFDSIQDDSPVWTPDGQSIVFASMQGTTLNIFSKAANGTGKTEQIGSLQRQLHYWPVSWADDKNLILTYVSNIYDIGVLSMEGDGVLKPLLSENYQEVHAQISPDGRWIAYASNKTDRMEIYVHPFPDVNAGTWKVSNGSGDCPLWSPDGREIFYRNRESIMAALVKTDPTFSFETPKALFRGAYVSSNLSESVDAELNPWDISPDGKRLLMMKEAESEASTSGGSRKINIVLNLFEEFKGSLPVD